MDEKSANRRSGGRSSEWRHVKRKNRGEWTTANRATIERLSLEGLPTNQNARESQKCQVHVWPFLMPQAQAAKLIQTCESALRD
jgi:hypothetical protein